MRKISIILVAAIFLAMLSACGLGKNDAEEVEETDASDEIDSYDDEDSYHEDKDDTTQSEPEEKGGVERPSGNSGSSGQSSTESKPSTSTPTPKIEPTSTPSAPEEIVPDEPEMNTTAFDDIFIAYAQGNLSRDWDTFQASLEDAGYTVVLSEGQFSVQDMANQDSYIYGDLGIDGLAHIGYRLINGTANRAVEVRYYDGYPRYYYEVTDSGNGNEANSLSELRNWLINGYGC